MLIFEHLVDARMEHLVPILLVTSPSQYHTPRTVPNLQPAKYENRDQSVMPSPRFEITNIRDKSLRPHLETSKPVSIREPQYRDSVSHTRSISKFVS